MNIRAGIILFLLTGLFQVGIAQIRSAPVAQGIPPSRCGTMKQDSINRIRYPDRATLDEFENALQLKMAEMRRSGRAGRTQAGIITVPIIVHIVHTGEPVGSGSNISQAQVQSQIAVLNEDFRRMAGTRGYNTNPSGADIEVEFCLSPVDENGVAMNEPGIERLNGGQADWTQEQIDSQLKPTTIWNPNLFYNIWTLKFNASEGGLVGYSQFPDQSKLNGIPANSPASTDGTVLRYTSFGSSDKGTFPVLQAPTDKGRTLTHETGHWLGLRHIWGDGVCADDFVDDTPTQRNASSGCPNSISCDNVSPAMVQNYMDYSNDVCFNIFTIGQKERMMAALEISPRRKSLVQANLCAPAVADVPTANFVADKQQCVLLESQVQFTDLSTNFPTQWQWQFEGGDPATSTERNPKVTYNLPGSFKVSLTATNSIGVSEPIVTEDYIVVSEEGLCNSFTNFDPAYTPSLLKLSAFGNYTGYLTGNNSAKSKAFSESFENNCGYKYISGARIRFGALTQVSEDAKVTVVVWAARGPQGSPNPIIEQKEILFKQIAEDVANDRPTSILFDRLTPVFSRPFHVGVILDYNAGDTVAIRSSANGEANNATSWVQDANGQWKTLTIAFGANVAMDIEPVVGVNPSVQVSASETLVYPGQEVILNGLGATIFTWDSDDGTIQDFAGPQLVVNPSKQTTYTTTGSGLDLCSNTATTTIYIRQSVVGVEETAEIRGVTLHPNPGTTTLSVSLDNEYQGDVQVRMKGALGADAVAPVTVVKEARSILIPLEINAVKSGVYFVTISMGKNKVIKKWIRL